MNRDRWYIRLWECVTETILVLTIRLTLALVALAFTTVMFLWWVVDTATRRR